MKTVKRKKISIRVPLPRQTGGYHKPDKGRGSYNRRQEKIKFQKEDH